MFLAIGLGTHLSKPPAPMTSCRVPLGISAFSFYGETTTCHSVVADLVFRRILGESNSNSHDAALPRLWMVLPARIVTSRERRNNCFAWGTSEPSSAIRVIAEKRPSLQGPAFGDVATFTAGNAVTAAENGAHRYADRNPEFLACGAS
jgi:hypothetical protein